MRKFNVLAVSCLLVVIIVSAGASEKKVSRKQVPAAVIAAFEKAYPGAKVKGYSREVENGKTCYEVESADGATNRDVLYNADGSVAEVEETIAIDQLPDAVKAAATKAYPKGTILKAEKTIHGESMTYEMRIKSGKAKHEVVVDPEGKVLRNK